MGVEISQFEPATLSETNAEAFNCGQPANPPKQEATALK
jgi:hypothetical protein